MKQTLVSILTLFFSITSLVGFTQSDSLIASEPVILPNESTYTIDVLIRKNEKYSISLNHINMVLRRGIDSTLTGESLSNIERIVMAVNQRINEKSERVNIKYLISLDNLLENLKQELSTFQRRVDREALSLEEVKKQLDAIRNDEVINLALKDSLLVPEIYKQTELLKTRWKTADSLYRLHALEISSIQGKLSNTNITIADFQEEIGERQRVLRGAYLKKEMNAIWEARNYENDRKLIEIIKESFTLNALILKRYLFQHWSIHLFIFSIFSGVVFWFFFLLKKIETKEYKDLIHDRASFIMDRPILSASILLLPIANFFYTLPPEIFVLGIQLFANVVATVLLKQISDKRIYYNWLINFALYFFYCLSSIYPETAFQERWWLFVLSLIGIVSAVSLHLNTRKSSEFYARYIGFMAIIFLILQSGSLLANIFGRYSLSKMLGIAATLSFVQAVSLYVFVLVILEAIYLQTEASKEDQGGYTSYIDFQKLQDKIKRLFTFISILVWLYYLTYNLNVYDYLKQNAIQFLNEPRNFGNTSFTLGSVLIFFVVIWLASIIAKYIAYFAEIRDQQNASDRNERLGSSILLFRLAVLIAGFFLAVTASGIPLDKIAIILGALSVGIGFGLQNIVNNLVSGVILAFERPIQVGDSIEIGSRAGTVQEIGIRSSKIKSFDGAEVIIPNGDLLAQHLTNWTLSDKRRRVEMLIGVAYGSNAEKVREIIMDALNQEGIIDEPAKRVLFQNFGDNAIEFRVLFWVADISTWVNLRSMVMELIYKRFNEEGIEIPFPQRDLHIKTVAEVAKEQMLQIKKG